MRVVDLFAGPGGWDQGLTDLGFTGTVVGLEWDAAACDTAMAAGHLRVQADVAQYPPDPFVGFDGLIASPPCQAFSMAGKGAGRRAIGRMLAHVWSCKDRWVDPPSDICIDDVRADLTLQPLRWVEAIWPEWVALEQVAPALPLWKAMAAVLSRWGYSTAATVLNAADFGVPQSRRRAFLVASRTGAARIPEATHVDPRIGTSLFGGTWKSMHSAIGWGYTDQPAPTICAGHNGKQTGAEWGGSSVRDGMRKAAATPRWVSKPDTTGANDIRLSVAEAGVLQSFVPDYPWRGTRTRGYEQIGNAVPPVLASAVLRPLVVDALEVAA